MDDTDPGSFCRATMIRLLDAGRNVTGSVPPQVTVALASPRQFAPSPANSPSEDPCFYCSAVPGGLTTFVALPFNVAERDDSTLARIDVYEYKSSYGFGENANRETVSMGTLTAIAGQPHEVFASSFPQATAGVTLPTMRLTGATEIGFAETPVIASVASAAGSSLAAGSYQYRVVLEWADMYGRRHQSAPSGIETLVLTAAGNATITVKQEFLSQRYFALPYYVLYRTKNGGQDFHRLPGSVTPGSTVGTYTDNNSDSDIADEEILYTDGGVLENVLAPSCRFMRYATGRLWCGGLWEPEIIECSKLAIPLEQIAFTGDPTHQVVLDGACTGLAAIDDQLVAFSKNRIQAIVGEGPNDQGIGTFSVRTISSGVGCIDHKSVLETDIGVFFQSDFGWYLLPRGLGAPQYVGEFFQTDEAEHRVCRGTAIRHGESGHVAMFLLNDVDTSDQIVVVYDLVSGQWTTDTYPVNLATIGVWPDGFAFCARDLTVNDGNPIFLEDPDLVGDATGNDDIGTHITATLRTNWIKPSGPAGWGQFKNVTIVAEPLAANQSLSMTIQADADAAETLPANVSTGITLDPAFRQITPRSQKAVGLRTTLADAAVSGAAAPGFQYVAIALEYFPDGGIRPPIPGER